jgi:hypothetical protein
MVVWYSLWHFGIFSPVLVCCTKKNLATLYASQAVHWHENKPHHRYEGKL